MNARSWSCVILSSGVGIPSTASGVRSCFVGSWIRVPESPRLCRDDSSSRRIRSWCFMITTSNGLEPCTSSVLEFGDSPEIYCCGKNYDLLSTSGPRPAILVLSQDTFDLQLLKFNIRSVCPRFSTAGSTKSSPVQSDGQRFFTVGCCHRHPNSSCSGQLLRELILVREKFIFVNYKTALIWRLRIGVFGWYRLRPFGHRRSVRQLQDRSYLTTPNRGLRVV